MFDQLKSLAVFAKVAEVKSFSGAAKALGITPPVVSQHVSQLEKNLEVALVYRSTRSLRLTDAGEKLAVSAQTMLDAAEGGIADITDENTEPHGKLSLAAPGIVNYEPFLDGITRYVRQYPDVDLTISFDDKIRDLIRDGFDMGIRGSATALQDSTLVSRKLLDVPMLLCCAPFYLEAHGPVQHPNDLAQLGYKWVGGNLTKKTVQLHRKDDPENTVEVPVQTTLRVDSNVAIHNLGLRGNGLFPMAIHEAYEKFEEGLAVEPLPDWQLDPISFYAIWPANAGARSLTRHFLNFLLAEIVAGEIEKPPQYTPADSI